MADDIDDLLREVEEKYLPNHSIVDQNNAASKDNTRRENGISNETSDNGKTASNKTTTRAHSSDIICRELEDELSDLLDDDGRMSDAALVSLRCKRSPRRSASARDLIMTATPSTSSNGHSQPSVVRDRETNKIIKNASSSTFPVTGIRSAPPVVHQNNSLVNSGSRSAVPTSCNPAVVEKQKCFPIYLSGVIDSIESNQAVRVCNSLRCTGCDFRVSQFAHYRWRPGVDYLFLRNHMPEFDRVRVKLATAKFCRAYACQCKFVTVKDLVDLHKLGSEFASKWICLGH